MPRLRLPHAPSLAPVTVTGVLTDDGQLSPFGSRRDLTPRALRPCTAVAWNPSHANLLAGMHDACKLLPVLPPIAIRPGCQAQFHYAALRYPCSPSAARPHERTCARTQVRMCHTFCWHACHSGHGEAGGWQGPIPHGLGREHQDDHVRSCGAVMHLHLLPVPMFVPRLRLCANHPSHPMLEASGSPRHWTSRFCPL